MGNPNHDDLGRFSSGHGYSASNVSAGQRKSGSTAPATNRLGKGGRLPADTPMTVTEHDGSITSARRLREEVANQKGAAVLYNTFDDWHNRGDKRRDTFFVARDDETGTIHGVVAATKNRSLKMLSVRDVYTDSVAPPGTGTKMLQSAAQSAKGINADMAVYNTVANARVFYEKTGAEYVPHSSVGNWSTKSRDALASGNPIPAKHSLWNDTHGNTVEPPREGGPDQLLIVPNSIRHPGTAPPPRPVRRR